MKKLVKNVQNGFLLAKKASISSSTTVTRAMSSSQFSGSFGHVTKQLIAPGSHVTNQLTRRQNSQLSSTKEAKEADSYLKLSYTSYERGKDASNKPPILIQHDLCGRKENFSKIGKQLFHLTKRNILLPDARNHGNSPESSAMSHKLMSGDIVKLLSGLKVKESSFVGFGLGGRIGMYTALVRPDLIDRLVVVSSSPVNTDARFQEWQNLIQSFYVIQTLKANFDSKKPVADLLLSQEFKLEATKALQPLIRSDTYRAFFLSNLASGFRASAIRTNPDLWKFPELDNFVFKKPVLFVTGDREKAWSISDKDIRKIRYYFPDSHFVKVSNSAFYPHLDSQAEFMEAVTSFLETDFQALNNGFSVDD